MSGNTVEKPALLIIDMVKDYFDPDLVLPVTTHGKKIIEPINRLAAFFRSKDWPVVFSTDAFQPDDFFFSGKMAPHSIIGTRGAEVIDELTQKEGDYWLPKPRMSAFFATGLETWLRERGVTVCAVGGITTNYCVLTTVMDAVSYNFRAVFLEDCCAAPSEQVHATTLSLYRRNTLYPLLQVQTSEQFLQDVAV